MQILVAGALGMMTLLALLPDAGHDQLWLLLAATRMGHHLDPYGPMVFESNPPLAIWISAFIVQLAGTLHLAQTITLKFLVVVLAAASAVCSGRLLPSQFRSRRWLLVLAFTVLAGVLPARDFGQRDHLLFFLTLPYILGASTQGMKVDRRLGVTLLAALGIALKPHQALLVAGVEMTVALLSRPRRPRLLEPLVFALAGIGYVLAMEEFAPRYFTEVLPLVRDTYWAFGGLSLVELLRASIELQLLILISLGLVILRPSCRSGSVLFLMAAGVGAEVAYLLQGTGWYYQQLPALSFFGLALSLQLIQLSGFSLFRFSRWMPFAAASLVLLALSLSFYFSEFKLIPGRPFPFNLTQTQPSPDPAFYHAAVGGSGADKLPAVQADSVATLTTSVDDSVMPAYQHGLTLAQRYPHLWMLPAILRNESGPPPRHRIEKQRLAELDAQQHCFMVEDLERWQPGMILVERCQDPAVHCQVLEDRHDDLLAFFLRDRAFAQIFARYRLWRSSGDYDAYVLR